MQLQTLVDDGERTFGGRRFVSVRWTRILSVAVLLLTVWGTTVLRTRLVSMPLERDEGEYALAGQLILAGHSPYERLYNMKWPGTYYSYAVIEAIFGQSVEGIRVGVLFVNVASVILVFLIARRLLDAYGAAAAALSYAMLSISPASLALAGHASHFVVLSSLAAAFVLQHALVKGRLWLYLLAGLFAGLAPVMKQPGIVFTGFILAWWLYEEFRARLTWKGTVTRGAALVVGIAVPFAVMLSYLAATHTFHTFWLWTVSYARHYGGSRSFSEAFDQFVFGLTLSIGEGFLFWMLAGLGLFLLPLHARTRARAPFLFGLLLFSLAGVCPSLIFRTHYFILMLPAISFLVGAAIFVIRRRLWSESPVLALAWIFGMLTVPLCVALAAKSSIYFWATPEAASQKIYGECPFVESVNVANYLRMHTCPTDRIAVLGSEPQIYFYSRRLPATGHIYTYAMMEEQPYAREFQEQMIHEIEAACPKYIVHVKMKYSWLESPRSDKTLFRWFDRYKSQNLKLVGLVERDPARHIRFRWDEPHMKEHTSAETLIAVYRRVGMDRGTSTRGDARTAAGSDRFASDRER